MRTPKTYDELAHSKGYENLFCALTEFIDYELPKLKDSKCGKFKVLEVANIYELDQEIYEYLDDGMYVDIEKENYIDKKIMRHSDENVYDYISKKF